MCAVSNSIALSTAVELERLLMPPTEVPASSRVKRGVKSRRNSGSSHDVLGSQAGAPTADNRVLRKAVSCTAMAQAMQGHATGNAPAAAGPQATAPASRQQGAPPHPHPHRAPAAPDGYFCAAGRAISDVPPALRACASARASSRELLPRPGHLAERLRAAPHLSVFAQPGATGSDICSSLFSPQRSVQRMLTPTESVAAGLVLLSPMPSDTLGGSPVGTHLRHGFPAHMLAGERPPQWVVMAAGQAEGSRTEDRMGGMDADEGGCGSGAAHRQSHAACAQQRAVAKCGIFIPDGRSSHHEYILLNSTLPGAGSCRGSDEDDDDEDDHNDNDDDCFSITLERAPSLTGGLHAHDTPGCAGILEQRTHSCTLALLAAQHQQQHAQPRQQQQYSWQRSLPLGADEEGCVQAWSRSPSAVPGCRGADGGRAGTPHDPQHSSGAAGVKGAHCSTDGRTPHAKHSGAGRQRANKQPLTEQVLLLHTALAAQEVARSLQQQQEQQQQGGSSGEESPQQERSSAPAAMQALGGAVPDVVLEPAWSLADDPLINRFLEHAMQISMAPLSAAYGLPTRAACIPEAAAPWPGSAAPQMQPKHGSVAGAWCAEVADGSGDERLPAAGEAWQMGKGGSIPGTLPAAQLGGIGGGCAGERDADEAALANSVAVDALTHATSMFSADLGESSPHGGSGAAAALAGAAGEEEAGAGGCGGMWFGQGEAGVVAVGVALLQLQQGPPGASAVGCGSEGGGGGGGEDDDDDMFGIPDLDVYGGGATDGSRVTGATPVSVLAGLKEGDALATLQPPPVQQQLYGPSASPCMTAAAAGALPLPPHHHHHHPREPRSMPHMPHLLMMSPASRAAVAAAFSKADSHADAWSFCPDDVYDAAMQPDGLAAASSLPHELTPSVSPGGACAGRLSDVSRLTDGAGAPAALHARVSGAPSSCATRRTLTSQEGDVFGGGAGALLAPWLSVHHLVDERVSSGAAGLS